MRACQWRAESVTDEGYLLLHSDRPLDSPGPQLRRREGENDASAAILLFFLFSASSFGPNLFCAVPCTTKSRKATWSRVLLGYGATVTLPSRLPQARQGVLGSESGRYASHLESNSWLQEGAKRCLGWIPSDYPGVYPPGLQVRGAPTRNGFSDGSVDTPQTAPVFDIRNPNVLNRTSYSPVWGVYGGLGPEGHFVPLTSCSPLFSSRISTLKCSSFSARRGAGHT